MDEARYSGTDYQTPIFDLDAGKQEGTIDSLDRYSVYVRGLAEFATVSPA